MSPKVPTLRPFQVEPSASQQSSISQRLCFLRERGDRVEVEDVAQRVRDHDGSGLFAARGFELAHIDVVGRQRDIDEDRHEAILDDGIDRGGKPAATVMTSSPGLSRRSPSLGEVSALTASRLAEEPELTSDAQRTPTKRASLRSNSSAKRPVVNQQSRAESTTELRSPPSITLPETGTGDSPGMNSVGGKCFRKILGAKDRGFAAEAGSLYLSSRVRKLSIHNRESARCTCIRLSEHDLRTKRTVIASQRCAIQRMLRGLE